jgi:hypothetical protein
MDDRKRFGLLIPMSVKVSKDSHVVDIPAWLRYAEKQVGYMACAILLNEVCTMVLALFFSFYKPSLHSSVA